MMLVFSVIFAFIWIVGVAAGMTFSGYIHLLLVASVLLGLAHCWLPSRSGGVTQTDSNPLSQRRLSRLLGWRPRPKRP